MIFTISDDPILFVTLPKIWHGRHTSFSMLYVLTELTTDRTPHHMRLRLSLATAPALPWTYMSVFTYVFSRMKGRMITRFCPILVCDRTLLYSQNLHYTIAPWQSISLPIGFGGYCGRQRCMCRCTSFPCCCSSLGRSSRSMFVLPWNVLLVFVRVREMLLCNERIEAPSLVSVQEPVRQLTATAKATLLSCIFLSTYVFFVKVRFNPLQ